MFQVFSSPGRYTQGYRATEVLGKEMLSLGIKGPLLLSAGKTAVAGLSDTWKASLGEAGYTYGVHGFSGACTLAEISCIRHAAEALGAGAIVGAGGGKALDAARAAAAEMSLPFVSCPTIASTDAPCSAVSIVYTEAGVVEDARILPSNPFLVLVDTRVILEAPPRFLVSGMGDALATWFEARACAASHAPNIRGGASTQSALALAELCYRTLLADGAAALKAAEAQAITPAFERIVEANTLLSGLGFESSGLAAAHAIHNGLTVTPQTRPYLHGEKVAFGTLAQLVLEKAEPSEIAQVLGFCKEVGLPVTLAQVGLEDLDPGLLEKIALRATQVKETIHNEPFPISAAQVAEAILAADALGRSLIRRP